MKQIILSIIIVNPISFLLGQDCSETDFCFSTQEQVDSFSIFYPECDSVVGFVFVKDAVENLESLHRMQVINGSLNIINCTNLQELNAFPNLKHVEGSLEISENENLSSIEGFDSLNTINGNLRLSANSKLENFSAFQNLERIKGALNITKNTQLEHINSFENLVYTGNIAFTNQPNLQNLPSFNALDTIDNI
ncbi:MAG: hypothetical protein MK226_06435 [Saprospiraceae bacterium]|nr:hypothetical protein [Saprospiraceae bacterium]